MLNDHHHSAAELVELDRRHVFHPFTALDVHERSGGLMITEGAGVWLKDATGRRYLDGMAGLWCVNVGYGRPEIAEALRAQALKLPYYHGFSSMSTDTPAMLADAILARAPAGMSKIFFGNSGSDANDTQGKLVWYYHKARGKPQKKKIISRRRGYHGVTMVSASLTGLDGLHAGFPLPLAFAKQPAAASRPSAARLSRRREGVGRSDGRGRAPCRLLPPLRLREAHDGASPTLGGRAWDE